MSEVAQQIYFLHIPKTAGTSLRKVIESQFRPEEICPCSVMQELANVVRRDVSELATYPVIAGHMGYTLLSLLPTPPRVITMLREPVARTISRFNYMRQQCARSGRVPWGHARFLDPDVSINDFLSFEPTRRLITNFQVRNLAQDFDLTKTYTDFDGNPLMPKMNKLFAYTSPGLSDRELLATAKRRLASFEFVGITERFRESLELLCSTFGWEITMNAPFLNVSSPSLGLNSLLSKQTIADIQECTLLDAELYKFATEIFKSNFSKHFPLHP
tara:strand:+ start:1295 stop:2113 length:819 start_codon:yes stop_codon:yes gene_type:complete